MLGETVHNGNVHYLLRLQLSKIFKHMSSPTEVNGMTHMPNSLKNLAESGP